MATGPWSGYFSVKTIAVVGTPLKRDLRSLSFLSGQ